MRHRSLSPFRRRRVLAAAALGTLAAITLASCAGSGASSNSGSADKITVWHYYSLDNQIAMLDDFSTTFEKTHPGVTVEDVYIPHDQLNQKLVASAGTKSGPDVIVFDGYSATTLADSGVLASMSDDWNSFADASQFAEGSITTVKDSIFAVQGYVNTLGLYYNKDILDQIGVEPPTTVDELEDAMAKAKAAGYQGITMAGQPNLQGAFQAIPWLTDAGFDYDNPQEADLTAAFERVRGWVSDGYLSPEVATWDQNVPFSTFTAGNIAFAENGNWQLSALASDATFKYGVVPLPLSSTGKVYLGGEAEGIGAFSKNPDLAWDYLEETFFSSQGELTALQSVGSIPTRADAASDPAISGDPYLSQFAAAIAKQGTPFPDTVIPPANVDTVYQDSGTAWSAALGGQQSPEDAAASFMKQLTPLLTN